MNNIISLKHVFAALSICALAACSSAQKKDAAPATPAQAPAAQAAAPKAKAAEAAKPAAGTLSCESGTDKRTAKVEAKGEGCEVSYTKFGETKVVSSSVKGMKHCEDSLEHIKKNLTGAGFTCK